jgi:hypothetical protein
VLLPALPTPLELTFGCCAPVPAGGTPFCSADLDSLALAPDALAVPMPLLAAAPAPTPVDGPAGAVVVEGPVPAFGAMVEFSAAAVPVSFALGSALLLSRPEQPARARPTPAKRMIFFTGSLSPGTPQAVFCSAPVSGCREPLIELTRRAFAARGQAT